MKTIKFSKEFCEWVGIERCCSKKTNLCSCSRKAGPSTSGYKRTAEDMMESLVEANN